MSAYCSFLNVYVALCTVLVAQVVAVTLSNFQDMYYVVSKRVFRSIIGSSIFRLTSLHSGDEKMNSAVASIRIVARSSLCIIQVCTKSPNLHRVNDPYNATIYAVYRDANMKKPEPNTQTAQEIDSRIWKILKKDQSFRGKQSEQEACILTTLCTRLAGLFASRWVVLLLANGPRLASWCHSVPHAGSYGKTCCSKHSGVLCDAPQPPREGEWLPPSSPSSP